MKELISVIVPIYNVEGYLDRCISSIIGQTYWNLEIILINDGSIDNSGELCEKWKLYDKRISVIHKFNGGLSSARNAGLNIAKGRYYIFVDSDDYIHTKMLERLYETLIQDNSEMTISNFYFDYGKSIEMNMSEIPNIGTVFSSLEILYRLRGSKGSYFTVAWNKLYKAELFKDIRFPEGKIHEDVFVAHRIFQKCTRVSCIDEPLYYYVQREGSIMDKGFRIASLDIVEAYLDRSLLWYEYSDCDIANEYLLSARSIMIQGYKELDTKDILFLTKMKTCIKVFRKMYLKIGMKNINKKVVIQNLIFCIHPRLYMEIFEKVNIKRKKEAVNE
ncbi:MAG: glycosyltransferase [Lachnospiraceae bacterium]